MACSKRCNWLNDCAGSEDALLLQPVAPVALGALYAALSDEDQCKSVATKGLFATGFLKPACFTLCACWACVASVQLQGTSPEIKACFIYQPKVLKGILSYVCATPLERVRTDAHSQACCTHSLRLFNQSSYVDCVPACLSWIHDIQLLCMPYSLVSCLTQTLCVHACMSTHHEA